jgi:hypothetical protein
MLLFKWLCPIPGLQSRIQRLHEGAHFSDPMRPVVGVNNVVKVGNSSHVAFSSNWAGAAFESRTPYLPCSLTRPRHSAGSTLATASLQCSTKSCTISYTRIVYILTYERLDDVSACSTHPFNKIPPLRHLCIFVQHPSSCAGEHREPARSLFCSQVQIAEGTPTARDAHNLRSALHARHRQCSLAALP